MSSKTKIDEAAIELFLSQVKNHLLDEAGQLCQNMTSATRYVAVRTLLMSTPSLLDKVYESFWMGTVHPLFKKDVEGLVNHQMKKLDPVDPEIKQLADFLEEEKSAPVFVGKLEVVDNLTLRFDESVPSEKREQIISNVKSRRFSND